MSQDRAGDDVWLGIAPLSAIEDPGAKGFRLDDRDWSLFGFVVRKGEQVYGYEDICPHAGRQLEWKPDAFLTRDRRMIVCSAHGAVFEIETGLCVAGPCPGKRLRALAARVVDGEVQVRRPGVTGD